MYQLINVCAASGGDAFLLLGAEKLALIDSGYSFCSKELVEHIRSFVGQRPVDYILLTHSHFDHATGSAYCKAIWPNAVVVSGQRAASIFQKPSALKTMEEMNISAALMCGHRYDPEIPHEPKTDLIVHDGDIIDLGGLTLVTMEVPGHTRDSLCFYCPEEELLIGSETFGVPNDGKASVMPCCIVGYQMTVDAIKRAAALALKHYLVPHYTEIHGKEADKFFKDALYWVTELKERVCRDYMAGKTVDQMVEDFKALYYTPLQASKQSEPAFLVNVRHKIPMILKECLGAEV